MKKKIFILRIILLQFIFLVVIAGCQKQTHISIDKEKGTLTVFAHKKNLSEVLSLMEKETGLKVFVENFADRVVDLDIRDMQINEAIGQIVGKDSRFYLDYTLKGDINIKGNTGSKEGRKVMEKPKITKLDPKESDRKPETTEMKNRKLPAEKLLETNEYIRKDGGKPDPKLSTADNKKPVKSQKNKIIQPPGEMLQLRFFIDKKGLRLEKITRLPGTPDSSFKETINDYVAAIEVGSRLEYLTSFSDPFISHSYSREAKEPHKIIKNESGYFLITIPSNVLNKNTINSATVTILKYRGGLQKNELSVNSFTKNEGFFEKVYTLPLKENSNLLNQ